MVCDRYSGSTLAYQGYGRGLDVDELRELDSWANGCRVPDLVVLLDLPVEVARERLGRSRRDRIESEVRNAIVALRAYNVPGREQLQILRYLGRQFLRAPMHFIFPGREERSDPLPK